MKIIIAKYIMKVKIKSLWARIILTSYRNLERVITSLDKTVDCLAMQGFNYRTSQSAEQLMNKIIDHIYRKEGLINLKVITEQIIKCMKAEYVELLELKFLKNKKFHEIADSLNISLRTVFRHYDKALNQFSCYLKLKGFTDEMLEAEYKDDPYIDKIKAKIAEDYRDTDMAMMNRRNMIVKRVLDNISIVCDEQININSY